MALDSAKFHDAAKNGDVAGVAITTVLALGYLRKAITKIAKATNTDITEEIADLKKAIDDLNTNFDRLTGWKPEE